MGKVVKITLEDEVLKTLKHKVVDSDISLNKYIVQLVLKDLMDQGSKAPNWSVPTTQSVIPEDKFEWHYQKENYHY